MAKKYYRRPVILGLEDDDNPTIIFGPSQGSSGYDSTYSFEEGFDESILARIMDNCDDFDLADMDIDGDYEITYDEYLNWYDSLEIKPW